MIFAQICTASAAPAPGLARAGAGRPRDARFEKFLQVQIFLRIFTVAPCKYTGDHRQIMGRSWAVSRIVQNYAQIVPNPYIITSAEVVPRNRGGPLRTWPLLIVILRISSTHFLQRVRVKNSKSGAARARVFFQDCVILPGALQRSVYLKRSVFAREDPR